MTAPVPTSPTGEAVPVTILTGFLGAGKTTVLNRLLTGDHGQRIGVLVNDFGAVNVDADLVSVREDRTVRLTNGCVCCEVREDLVSGVERLLRQNPSLDHVVLEGSGVADPESLVMTFSDARYEDLLRLDSVTCVVDLDALLSHGDDAGIMHLQLRQIAFADLVVLNKTDLVGPERIRLVRDWIGQHLQRVRLIETSHGDVPVEVLLAGGTYIPQGRSRGHAAHPAFRSWHVHVEQPVDLTTLERSLRRLPGTIYRCKGFVYSDTRPDERLVLQVVGRRINVSSLGGWQPQQPATDLVFIGAPDTDWEPDELMSAATSGR